jgi:hypothetical protein
MSRICFAVAFLLFFQINATACPSEELLSAIDLLERSTAYYGPQGGWMTSSLLSIAISIASP